MFRNFPWRALGSLLFALACIITTVRAQTGTQGGEWRTYGGDLESTHYVPHDQINAGNFSKLQVAWRFKTDVFGVRPDYNLQTTPLMINGVLYATVGSRRDAVCHRRGDGRTAVDVPHRRGQARHREHAPAVGPRCGVLDRWKRRRAHFHGDVRVSAHRARSEDRDSGPHVRPERHPRSEAEQRPGA